MKRLGASGPDHRFPTKTMHDKERQDLGKADTASNAGTHAGRLGDKGRQDLG